MPKRPKCLEADLPHPGSVFLAPLSDGKFGVLRVLKTKTQSGIASAFVAASPWIGSTPIRPSDHEIRLPLFLTHHSYNGQIAGLWVFTPPPPSFIPLGDIDIDAEEDVIERETYSRWESISMQILVQWRWDNDREALLIEEATRKAQETEERKIAAERRAAMLRTLTLDSVSERVWFDSWDEESDGSCLTESRRVVSSLIKSLRTSPKITKAVARRLLKGAVKDFNRLDAKRQFIETVQREDICDAFEIIMAATRYPELADEVEQWRDW